VHTYAHDLANNSPILGITSPAKRCGKTTLLTLLKSLCAKAIGLSSLTSAILYWLIENEKPTLLIDEAETFLDTDELRGVLNSGFSRDMAAVYRMVNGRPKRLSTWAPKAIACIGGLADTLQDRAIEIRLQRRTKNETVKNLRDVDRCIFNTLSSKAVTWVNANQESLRKARPEIPEGLSSDDRACDKWYPLLAIADIAGGHWPATARAAAIALRGKTANLSKEAMLFADLREIFTKANAQKLPTTEILKYLASIDERPWVSFKHGRQMTANQLAQFLKRYGVEPQMHRFGRRSARGYTMGDLAQAWERYAQ